MRFDLDSAEGSRRAAEWILGLMSRIPATHQLGLEVKQGQGARYIIAAAPRAGGSPEPDAAAIAAAGGQARPAGGRRRSRTNAGTGPARSGRASLTGRTWN